jgi:NAD(P)-dependent dehydrogenase (short-subunit alcohol dehydrogenase family)
VVCVHHLQQGKENPLTKTRVLVTGATGRIGGAVAAQLLEKGVTTRAMVHRNDARSARLQALGAEVAVADMFDIQQVQAALDGVDRLYFNPPYHPCLRARMRGQLWSPSYFAISCGGAPRSIIKQDIDGQARPPAAPGDTRDGLTPDS